VLTGKLPAPYLPSMPKLAVSSARRRWAYAVAAVLLLPALCTATDLRLVAVTPGQSAGVVIDHGAAVTMEVGETIEGVKLLRVDRASAVLNVNGITRTLPLAADVGSLSDTVGGSVTLVADARGQFFTSGTVNGRPMRFIVDTGATFTTLSRADARRIGLEYLGGTPMRTSTANGVANGWRVSLASVSVGDMTVRGVDAMVIDNDG